MPPRRKQTAAPPGEEAAASNAKKTGEHHPQDDNASGPHQTEPPPRVGMVSSLDELPHVASYLKRVGATVKNMHSAVIKATDHGGYSYDAGRIMFDLAEGSVSVSGDAVAPTKEEADAITAEIKRTKFPTLIKPVALADLPNGIRLSDPNLFVCHDFDDRIVMLHHRYETDDGKKGFVPWTRWSDGQWRSMEPDVLPFYGLPSYKKHSWLVLHEGEKAAARLKRMQEGSEDTDKFPWWSDLQHAHHVGWIGGVHAINKSDWRKLAAQGWKRVTIVADNDDDGKGLRAAQTIAKEFHGIVEIVTFDERFKDGFDLGDPWPEDQFDKHKRYIGPVLRDCILPATQATIELEHDGPGRPTRVLRDEYARQIAYTADPPRIIYRSNPSRDMRPETFNIRVAPFSHAKDTAALVWRHLSCQHERMVYRPGDPPGTVNMDGMRGFNVYEGAQIKPLKGDPGPWEEFLAHLFPVERDRDLVNRWLATLIAMPKVRMHYGMLLISTQQGVGKNTLGNVLRTLLGRQNVSFPSEASVVKSDFNGWLARKRLIFISEFYSGESRKAYDRIKSYVTDEEVEINEKGVNQYSIDNYAHFIACSNSEKALHLDDDDRRWMVPLVTERKKPDTYWRDLYAWLHADGPGIVLQWAVNLVADGNHERTGAEAPISERKEHIVAESRTEGRQLARSLGEWLVAQDRQLVIRLSDVRTWIAGKRGMKRPDGSPDISNRRLETGSTITAMLKKVPGITVWADAKRPKFGVNKDTVFMNFDPGPEAVWAEVKGYLSMSWAAEADEEEPM